MLSDPSSVGPSSSCFQAWFKGSKVVDEEGRPLVVYHGTPYGDFERFDVGRASRDSFRSVWFTECEGQALIYALGQKRAPHSIRPVIEALRVQRAEMAVALDSFERDIRLTTFPDGTLWESFDRDWLCRQSAHFDYAGALREAYPEPASPRIHRAYLQARVPYIGADESIAKRLQNSACGYDSFLSIMAPYPEWAIPSEKQICMLAPKKPSCQPNGRVTFGMAHSAARLRERWTYDHAVCIARKADSMSPEHIRAYISSMDVVGTDLVPA